MKKWIGPLLSLFLAFIFVIGLASGTIPLLEKGHPKEDQTEAYRMIFAQNEKKEEEDSHMLLVLREIQRKLDEWLKTINERIESQDVTRFEVRFLEVLRNILEWIKEKVDAKVEEGEKEKPKGKKGKGLFREIHQTNGTFFKMA